MQNLFESRILLSEHFEHSVKLHLSQFEYYYEQITHEPVIVSAKVLSGQLI